MHQATPHRHLRRLWRGFTLIELLVGVAVVAIIAAVAFPSFQSSIIKSRRADAFASVAMIQQAQERWRANNPSYSTCLAATALNVAEPNRYALSVTEPGGSDLLANGYIVTAIGRNGQDSDKQCRKLSMRMANGNLSYAGCFDCANFTYTSTQACWSK